MCYCILSLDLMCRSLIRITFLWCLNSAKVPQTHTHIHTTPPTHTHTKWGKGKITYIRNIRQHRLSARKLPDIKPHFYSFCLLLPLIAPNPGSVKTRLRSALLQPSLCPGSGELILKSLILGWVIVPVSNITACDASEEQIVPWWELSRKPCRGFGFGGRFVLVWSSSAPQW